MPKLHAGEDCQRVAVPDGVAQPAVALAAGSSSNSAAPSATRYTANAVKRCDWMYSSSHLTERMAVIAEAPKATASADQHSFAACPLRRPSPHDKAVAATNGGRI